MGQKFSCYFILVTILWRLLALKYSLQQECEIRMFSPSGGIARSFVVQWLNCNTTVKTLLRAALTVRRFFLIFSQNMDSYNNPLLCNQNTRCKLSHKYIYKLCYLCKRSLRLHLESIQGWIPMKL